MKRLRTPTLLGALTAIVLTVPATASAASTASAACPGAAAVPTAATAAKARAATVCLINGERRKHGLRTIRQRGALRVAAGRYAAQMVRTRSFSHVSPGGSSMTDRVRGTNYLARAAGWALAENIAYGQGRLASPQAIVRSWMRSPGHRRNILTPGFRDIGLGLSIGTPVGGSGATYVADFGRRGR